VRPLDSDGPRPDESRPKSYQSSSARLSGQVLGSKPSVPVQDLPLGAILSGSSLAGLAQPCPPSFEGSREPGRRRAPVLFCASPSPKVQ
jgi:hypothetical protein